MAVNQENKGAALIVVDVQVGVMRGTWEAPRIIENIRTAVEKARKEGVPVVWVQHSDQELVFDSPDWQIVPELLPAEGEVRIHKHYNSSFEETSVEEELNDLGVSHVFLAGAATNWCIRATAYGALERGYDLTLLKDAHTTEEIEFEDGSRIEAEDIIRELNVGMHWITYPGRTNNTASVAEVDFTNIGTAR
ncbi:MAG: cysteine hydrolase family protein [Candidatus Promineifilaceae bacterium]